MPTTPMSAPCCIPASRPGRRRSRSPSTPARRGRRCWPRSSPAMRPRSASGSRCSRAISSAASRAPAPATGSAPRRRRDGCCFAARMRRARSPTRSGLAGGYASGLAQFYYSGGSAKRIHAAHAAEGGVAAALLAAEGYSGPNDIIEGQGGFARAYADGWNPALIEDGLGQRFHLMDVLVKSHAAAARVAAGIDAMLELRQQHKFAIDDIASMALGIPKIIQGRLTNPHPVDLQAAQMCLPFSVALASKVALSPGRIATLGDCGLRSGPQGPKPACTRGAHRDCARRRGGGGEQRAFHGRARHRDAARRAHAFACSCRRPRAARPSPSPARSTRRASSQELSSRVPEKVCSEIVAMSRNLDRLDPRWLGGALSGHPRQ